jgi:GTPase SAR1 family protein
MSRLIQEGYHDKKKTYKKIKKKGRITPHDEEFWDAYSKRIVVIGASGSGKTTFTLNILKDYGGDTYFIIVSPSVEDQKILVKFVKSRKKKKLLLIQG